MNKLEKSFRDRNADTPVARVEKLGSDIRNINQTLKEISASLKLLRSQDAKLLEMVEASETEQTDDREKTVAQKDKPDKKQLRMLATR